jgi:hypothetical protein
MLRYNTQLLLFNVLCINAIKHCTIDFKLHNLNLVLSRQLGVIFQIFFLIESATYVQLYA